MNRLKLKAVDVTGRSSRLNSIFAPHIVLTFLGLLLVVGVVIGAAGGDPLALAEIGTRFSEGDPAGTEGYDGQFVYYIARDLDPESVVPLLDVPAYRYQRILLPLLARILGLGQPGLIAWSLPLITILSQVLGTWAVSELLKMWGVSQRYALTYGLWVGFVLAVRLNLPEPLAYGLVAGALLANARGRTSLSWVLYGLAVFAKEVVVFFVVAQLAADLFERRWREAAGLALTALLPFALFQVWLYQAFGQPGLGSGGAMATPFEVVPFMGLLRIGGESLIYLGAMLLVFGPAVILPAIWGLWRAAKSFYAQDRNVLVLAVGLNALAIVFLPFSTFRETGGLLRFACGLALALLLYAGRYRSLRALRYSYLWLVLNVFLLK